MIKLIKERASLRKIAINMTWLVADKLIAIVSGLFVGAWVARYLGPTQFGIFNYAVAFVALFYPLAELGLSSIVVRNIVRAQLDKDEILGTTVFLQFFAGSLVLFLAISIFRFIRPEDEILRLFVAIMSGSIVFRAFSNTADYWFQSQVRSKYTVWVKNIVLVLISLFKIVLILVKAPLIAFVWATLIQSVLIAIGLLTAYQLNNEKLIAWRGKISQARILIRDSWPLIFSGLAIVVYMRVDMIMLGEMSDERAIGIYAVAVRLSELWYFLPVAIASSLFPAIIRSRESQGIEIYQKKIQAFYDLVAGSAYTIILPLMFIASPLIVFLFGIEYAEAGSILIVHIWAFLFVSVGVARGRWLVAENMIRFDMIATLLGAITNIILNVWLIPQYSGLGAAWATTVSYALSGYFSSLLSRDLWSVFRQQSLSLLVPFRLFSLKNSFYAVVIDK